MLMFRIKHDDLEDDASFVGYGEFEAAAQCAIMQNNSYVELVHIASNYETVLDQIKAESALDMTERLVAISKSIKVPDIAAVVVEGLKGLSIVYIAPRGTKTTLIATSEIKVLRDKSNVNAKANADPQL